MSTGLGARDASARPHSETEGPETACHDAHCITCSDEAIPVRVVSVDEAREVALCEGDDGERTTVEIALVAPVALGEELLVHAGTAIARAA